MKSIRCILRNSIPNFYCLRYQKAEKIKVIEEFINLTGYNRFYASWLLRNYGRKVVMHRKSKENIIFVGEIVKIKRKRKRIYDEEVKKALEAIGKMKAEEREFHVESKVMQ